MNRKIVFFDIDGTLWDWNGVIPKSTKEAIKRLKENGHIPVISTGRSRGNVRKKELLDMGFEAIIAACGQHVECDGEIIYEDYLDTDTVVKIIDLSKKYNVPIVLEGPKKDFISDTGFEEDTFVDIMKEVMGEDAVLLSKYSPEFKVNKVSGDEGTFSNFEPFKEEMQKLMRFMYHGLASGVFEKGNSIVGVFECTKFGASKADGIKLLCEKFGIKREDSLAFGDSVNDLEMIEYAGIGIAMGDGSEELKAKADYVTDGIWEDGIKNGLMHFGLI